MRSLSSSHGHGAAIRRLSCLGLLLWTEKLTLADAVEEAWVARLDYGDENESAVDVAVDRLGNVYVTGSGSRGGTRSIRTFKYDPDGKLLWRATFQRGPRAGASGVGVDEDGGAYVLGTAAGEGEEDSIVLLKYADDGDLAWSRDIGLGGASSLQVGADGNVWVGGQVTDPISGERAGIIAKVSPLGDEIWRHLESPGSIDEIHVARNGALLASLQEKCTTQGCRESSFRVLKLSASGEKVWSWAFDREGRDTVSALDVNEAGEVYVMGSYHLDAPPAPPAVDWLLIKITTDGHEEWTMSLGSPLLTAGPVLALDSESNAYVGLSPRSEGAGELDFEVELRKFSPNGTLLWTSLWEGPVPGGQDIVFAIDVDRLDGVYLSGFFTKTCLEGCGVFRTGTVTLKYGPDGSLGWDMRSDAGASHISSAIVYALKVDGSGNVHAAGESYRQETGTGLDFLTIKYRQPGFGGGGVFLRGDANGDGRLNVTDPLLILRQLFQGGLASPCARAADPDDSGALDLADAVYVLQYLFRSGAAPPAPYPECGDDPTPDDLPCESPTCA